MRTREYKKRASYRFTENVLRCTISMYNWGQAMTRDSD